MGLSKARLTVGGSAARRNVFDESFAAFYGVDNSDSDIQISYNRMKSYAGVNIFLWQAGGIFPGTDVAPLPAPRYAILDNTMLCSKVTADDGSVIAGAGGVFLEDDSWLYGEPNRLDAVIADNTIFLDNDGWDAGIDGFYSQGVQVLRNRISGTGLAAIDVGTAFIPYFPYPVGPASGWKIIGNDVGGVKAVTTHGGPGARIWLGEGASHCLVVGGHPRTDVLDQGTDNVLIDCIRLPLRPIRSAQAAAPMKSVTRTAALRQVKQL